jgi:hypothetical protein
LTHRHHRQLIFIRGQFRNRKKLCKTKPKLGLSDGTEKKLGVGKDFFLPSFGWYKRKTFFGGSRFKKCKPRTRHFASV